MSDSSRLPRHLFALVSISVSWLCAILLIPEDNYYQPGALTAAATVLSLGLLGGTAFAAVRHHTSLFRAESILMFGLIYWILLDAIQGSSRFDRVSREALVICFSAIALFAMSLESGSLLASIRPMRTQKWRVSQADDLTARFLIYAAICCFGFGTLRVLVPCNFNPGCIVESFFVPRLEARWYTANLPNIDAVLRNLSYFGYLILPLTVLLWHKEKRFSGRVIFAGLLAFAFLLILFRDGGRRNVGVVVGASGLLWVLLYPRLRPRHFVAMISGIIMLLFVMQVMVAWRYTGIGTALMAGASLKAKNRSGIAVDTNLLYMGYIADRVPKVTAHTGLIGITYIFTAGIPRSILPASAPRTRGFNLVSLAGLRMGRGYTWTASAVGDLYLIGGYLAIAAGGIIFGILANFCNRLLSPGSVQSRFIYAMAAMTLFAGLRAIHDIPIIGLSVAALWAILWARKIRFESQPSAPLSHGPN